MRGELFNTFWHGGELPPMHWACLASFIARGHRVRLFAYAELPLPSGVERADARELIGEEEVFEFEGSFSGFSNLFRYTLLLERGGWWIDSDVYCQAEEVPDCAYAWARQDAELVNGAILKFPAGDPALAAVLAEATAIGRDVKVWGDLGPQLLTRHLGAATFAGHAGSTADFYPVHYLETHFLWLPEYEPALRRLCAGASFVHLWGSMFSYYGIDMERGAPAGSFLQRIYDESGARRGLDVPAPQVEARTREAIAAFVAKPWVRKKSTALLGYDVADALPHAAAGGTVTVVIATYNMGWCLRRAVASCVAQTHPPAEILIVDDGSHDDTAAVAKDLLASDARIRHLRLATNSGHLAAIRHGVQAAQGEWVALLDADDELVPDSLAQRLAAARRHRDESGEWPQLVYGDLYWEKIAPGAVCRFKRISGRDFRFVSRELSLCQTSTILLGREAIAAFPPVTNPYNTDDEIVLAVARHHPIVHAGVPVTVTHAHASATRMSNSSRRRLQGIAQLVRDHRRDILREHGRLRLLLWRLRVLRVFLEWQQDRAGDLLRRHAASRRAADALVRAAARWHGRVAARLHRWLTSFLEKRFEQVYF